MTLQSLKLIRQQLTFHYQSKTRLSKGHKIISIFRRFSLSVVCSAVLFPASVVAQITPDNSVPTTVEETEENMQINGGEREGNNLFHSFDEFSIPNGMEAIFENATDIENIFTRVTGGEVSNIDGILTTQGDANFFFINPNGIVFGDNASLNVGGSFIASTAESVQFEDGSEFSATNPDEPILDLTGFPVGLGLGELPGAIIVNGQGNQITPLTDKSPTSVKGSTTGLSIDSGETLGLIGGNLNFNGGTITTPGSRIELGSVSSGSVSLTQVEEGLTFGFDNVTINRNIALNNLSLLNSSSEGQGAISLTGNNINITNGSYVLIQNTGNISSGDISINATDSLTLSGTADDGNVASAISAEALSTEKGADITISISKLVLRDAGSIRASTFTDATGGNITINATESVQLLENTSVNQNRLHPTSLISSPTLSSGDGGSIQISTPQLRVLDGDYIAASTFDSGHGGNLTIKADEIEVSGLELDGNEIISRSVLSASSGDVGDSGNVDISTTNLKITDGGQILSSAFSTGNGGSITINASSSVEVSGVSNGLPSMIGASGDVAIDILEQKYELPDQPSGSSGNLRINTPTLNVNSGAEVSVKNDGTGNAGTLSINAEDINLDNTGNITAAAASGNGGNINLDTDNLQIDNESQITTEAGSNGDGGNITINTSNLTAKKNSNLTTSAVGGDGGNISITADTILGLENSDITANAVGGNGGNITITTDLIYGYQARSQTTPFEDITASSELGIDGTVTINSPETSTEEDLILSIKKIELDKYKKLLTGSCLDENRPIREEFVYSGGGIPESPDDYSYDEEYFLSPNPPSAEEVLRQRDNSTHPINNTVNDNNTPPIWQPGEPPIQANAVFVRNGRKFLVAVNKMTEGGSSLCDPETANADPYRKIKVKQIKFIGNKVFSDSHLKNISTVKEGSTVGIEDLFALQTKINKYYINQGYISSGVFIASQEMTNGVIKVQVIEGTLTEVEIKGLSRFQKSYFTKRLPMGKPLKQDKLLEILTKLRNNPLVEDLEAKLIKLTPETSRLILKIKEKNPLTTQFAVSNSFSPSVGTYGGEANFNYHFLGNGDILNFGYSRTNKTGLVRYEAGYTFPINKYDGTINVSYTDAETNIVEEPTCEVRGQRSEVRGQN
jgi:filamentous hemagglutinin family protein